MVFLLKQWKTILVYQEEDVANYYRMNKKIKEVIEATSLASISDDRKEVLQVLINFIKKKYESDSTIRLNFICTHNSRRSQFTQVWAKLAAEIHGITIDTFSGGVEVTACNPLTVASLKRFGFEIIHEGEVNPEYRVSFNKEKQPILLSSKLFDDEQNPSSEFAAVMTCSHADENCPFVTGCEERISLRYDDPKAFDGTPMESTFYDYRSFQIASEMIYVFSKIN